MSTIRSDIGKDLKNFQRRASKKNIRLSEEFEIPVTPNVKKRRLKSLSPSSPSNSMDASSKLQEIASFQESLLNEESGSHSTICAVQYFNLDEMRNSQITDETLKDYGILLQIMPNGKLHYFGINGWIPLPSCSDVLSDSDQRTPNKKKKSRAHVLKPGALSLIPYGTDERVTWTKRIFQFIGKMRKVLGDRSLGVPWGGSIIDSMIGVYLTQNVSDTYSSKAFMNIAAKFPAPSSKLVENGSVWRWCQQLKKNNNKISIKKNKTSRDSELSDVIASLEQFQWDLQESATFGNTFKELSLEWMRSLDYDSVNEVLTSKLEGFGEKSVACVTLLAFHWKSFPVDVNVARICARLGWVPLTSAEKIEDLDLYAPDLEVHKYLKKRLLHLDFDVLYELHYQMITMGKVFCTKRNPRCGACPLRNKCEYALSGGKKFESNLSVKKEKQEMHTMAPKTPIKREDSVDPEDIEDIVPFKTDISRNLRSRRLQKTRGESEVSRILELTQNINIDTSNGVDANSYLTYDTASKILALKASDPQSIKKQYKSDLSHITTFHFLRLCRFYSKLIHPDKCQDPNSAVAFSLLSLAYHQLTSDKDITEERTSDDELDEFVTSQYPLTIRVPMTWSKTRNVLNGFVILDSTVLPSCLSFCTQGMVLIPDPRSYSISEPFRDLTKVGNKDDNCDVFILVSAREAMNNRFPLNGTFFQINELFLMDGDPFSVPFSLLVHDKIQNCRIYFGSSISHITLGMRTEEIQHLFNHSYICIRSFNFETRISSSLHSFLLP